VHDDPIKEIPMNDLVDFINNYNLIFEKQGILLIMEMSSMCGNLYGNT